MEGHVMKRTIVIVLVALFIMTGFISNQWSVVNAQGTIPLVPPTGGNPEPVIPVTGGTTKSITIPDACKDVNLEIKDVAKVTFLDCPKPGTTATMTVLTKDELVDIKPLTYLTEVFQVITDSSYNGKMKVQIFLAEAEKEALKKDPELGLYRYDVIKGEWQRIVAVLDGDYLTAEVDGPGIFVIGK
jgi:hypothetical protein